MIPVLLALATFAAAIGISSLAWWLLGRPEHICPGCDRPASQCDCNEESENG